MGTTYFSLYFSKPEVRRLSESVQDAPTLTYDEKVIFIYHIIILCIESLKGFSKFLTHLQLLSFTVYFKNK